MTVNDSKFTQISEHDDFIIVTFNGMLDAINFEANEVMVLQNELNAIVEVSDGRTVIFDFEDRWYNVCAATYGVLVHIHKKLDDRLLMCSLSDTAREVFQMNRLASLFNIFPTRDEAIASFDVT